MGQVPDWYYWRNQCNELLVFLRRKWGELSPKGKRVSLGVGCGVLILLFLTFRSCDWGVKIDGDDIEVRYTTDEMVNDPNWWAKQESIKIAKLVWRISQKYPKQIGFITVNVIYGGKGKVR